MNEIALDAALADIGRPLTVGKADGAIITCDDLNQLPTGSLFVPACQLENSGDLGFCADHRMRYAYVAGAMANGIGSADIAEELGRAGMLAFFGAAGLGPATVEAAID